MSGGAPTNPHGSTSGPFSPTTTTTTDDNLFLQAYDAAKLNDNWQRVTNALKAHPDWLTRIPQNRRWTIMHQIVFSGNRQHLDEVLAYQINNPNFRLLFKAADGKTVRDVAFARQEVHKNMLIHIERLVFCDQMLNNAKEDKWDLVKTAIRQKTDLANEKPPYRRRYLVHQLAAKGLLQEFKEINEITQLRIDLLAEGQTPIQLARAKGHTEFANHLETLPPMAATGYSGASSSASSSGHPPGKPKYSPGFYDDISISIMPPGGGPGFSISGFDPTGFHTPYSHHALAMGPTLLVDTHHAHEGGHSHSYSGSGASGYGGGGGASGGSYHSSSTKSSTKKPVAPAISEDEQSKYEKAVTANADKVSGSQLLDSVTCCITKQILRDPVVAADGFTYEREAITKWFEHSKRSPMTNQELESLELKPNHAIKSILNSLHGSSASGSGKSKDKDSGKK